MSFYEFAKFFGWPFLKLFFKVHIVGKHNIDCENGGLVLVSNHKSNLDPLFLGLGSRRRLFFMAKKELFSVPILSYIIKKLGAFPVERNMHDFEAISYAKNVVDSGRILAMFPEGTRSKIDEVLKFKLGAVKIAAATGCKIVPCSIFYYGFSFFRRKVFLEYGKALTLQQLAGSGSFNFRSLSYNDLKELNLKLRNLVVKMNDNQKKLNR